MQRWSIAGQKVKERRVQAAYQQQTLNIAIEDESLWENFTVQPANAVLHQHMTMALQQPPAKANLTYIWGAGGSGRTHVLQATCHALYAQQKPVFYVSLASHAQLAPQILQGLDYYTWVCLDNIDAVVGQPAWEEALFYWYNAMMQAGRQMLVSAAKPPAQTPWCLADLRSRMTQGAVFQCHALDESGLAEALQLRVQRQGLQVSPQVIHYLLTHFDRNSSQIFPFFRRLEQFSLQKKRAISIPTIKLLIEKEK